MYYNTKKVFVLLAAQRLTLQPVPLKHKASGDGKASNKKLNIDSFNFKRDYIVDNLQWIQ
jgi:hypothetical protein